MLLRTCHGCGEPQHICSDTQETPGLPRPRHRQRNPAHHRHSQAHHLARNEGGPLVPPGRQRTSDTTPKRPQAAPARKRIASRSKRFRPKPSGKGAGGQPWCCLGLAAPGRPLVLSREWERTASHIRGCARERAPRRERSTPARVTGKAPPAPPGAATLDNHPKTTPGQPPCHAGKLSCLHIPWFKPSAAAADPPASPCSSQTGGSAAPASGDCFPPSAPR